MRYGTRTQLKRRWTPKGHRPACPVKIGYEFGYLYTAICPFTGDLFVLMLPSMKKECFEIFGREFAAHLRERQPPQPMEKTLLIVDGAGSHQESALGQASLLQLEKLPPACPELNPVERFFQELRRELSNQVFETTRAVEKRIQEILKKYWDEPSLIIRLTSYSYINTTNLF